MNVSEYGNMNIEIRVDDSRADALLIREGAVLVLTLSAKQAQDLCACLTQVGVVSKREPRHRIATRRNITVVRERIERQLGVETTARREGDEWAIYFSSPRHIDLDFLRPDVLPPQK